MDKPLEFDEVINGMRVTVGYDGRKLKTEPMEAPYDVTERHFVGGRDAEPLAKDNPLVRFALDMPPVDCTRSEYLELKQEAAAIGEQVRGLVARLDYLNVRLHAYEYKRGKV